MNHCRHRIVRGDPMAYKIVYGEEPYEYHNPSKNGIRLRILTAALLLVFCFLVRLAWPGGTALLQNYVLPGESTVTEEAFEAMLSDLRAGEPLNDALTTFCKDVIQNGTSHTP